MYTKGRKAEATVLLAARLFILLALGALVLFFAGKLLRLLLPFLIAGLFALVTRPAAAWLSRRARLPRPIAGIAVLCVLLLLLGGLVTWGCQRLLLEVQKLAESASNDPAGWSGRLSDLWETLTSLSEHIPLLSHLKGRPELRAFWEAVDAKLAEFLSDALTGLSARIPDLIASVARAIPGAIVFALTTLLASFYLCADPEGLAHALTCRLSPAGRRRLDKARELLSRLGSRYVKAYFLLFLLTFGELLVGFALLRLPYIFLPALLISIFDILPLFGVGTVLLPWGAIELLRGNTATGIGLLILCAILLILRQISEPRIVGGSLGLHPLVTLFAVYVGLQLMGVLGMLIGPAVALLIKGFWWDTSPSSRT